jgi:hypothetical protein
MKLIDIATSGNAVPFVNISGFIDLVTELQTVLANNGLLDPPADGKFGQVSKWALGEAAQALNQGGKTAIDAAFASSLLETATKPLFPIKSTTDFAGKIVAHMTARNHWISRHPNCVNIIYVEGSKPDGTPNDNAANEFNDVRMVVRINPGTGEPEIVGRWDATTEPGKFYTENPMPGVAGAARIGFGQYKSWAVGTHGAGGGAHEALVQVADVTVFRDANRDYKRAGDLPDTGMFGINQHWGYNMSPTNVHNASAGCLVGRSTGGHVEFMKLVKGDRRYAQNNAYRFLTTIIDRKELD